VECSGWGEVRTDGSCDSMYITLSFHTESYTIRKPEDLIRVRMSYSFSTSVLSDQADIRVLTDY